MDFLISGVASFINQLASALPTWSFSHDVAADVTTLTPYFQLAHTLLPIETAFTLFSLFIGLHLLLIALYWLDRVVNLLRGAG